MYFKPILFLLVPHFEAACAPVIIHRMFFVWANNWRGVVLRPRKSGFSVTLWSALKFLYFKTRASASV